MKKPRQSLEIKIKSTGYTYLPGSQYCESEGHLKLRPCLHESVINSAPSIGDSINKMNYIDNSNLTE